MTSSENVESKKPERVATLRIALKDRDSFDGIRERIGDIAFEHGVENDGSDLNFTLTGGDELRENWSAFIEALNEFFRVCRIKPTKMEETLKVLP